MQQDRQNNWFWGLCVQLCWGLNYSHLLQWGAAVKAGQMLYLVVRQLPTTIHKRSQWPAVDLWRGKLWGWRNNFSEQSTLRAKRFSRTIIFRVLGWWLEFCNAVIVHMLCLGHDSQQCASVFLLLSPPCVCVLTALWGETAAHIDPEGGLRDRPESTSYRQKENPLIIVEMQVSERISQSCEPNLVRQGAV